MAERRTTSQTAGRTDDQTQIHLEPYLAEAEAREELQAELLQHEGVRANLGSGELELAEFELLDKDAGERARFEAVIVESIERRCVRVRGILSVPHEAQATPLTHRARPTQAHFEQAVEHVLRHNEVSRLVTAGSATDAYQPMPPFLDVQRPDGTVERMVTVGIRSEGGDLRHRIVAVSPDGRVDFNPDGVPQPSTTDCEPSPPRGGCTPGGGRDQVRVRVIRGGTTLWDFILVRPRASSGTNGSGVELRFVDYKGQRVLYRAHVPILNVQYGEAGARAGCGPTYRDWQNQESCFQANGSDPVGLGFRLCSAQPESILESGSDGGNFSGVALWYDGSELRLLSQLSAGWYRYISDWRLRNDGSIGPRFGFAGTANPCTCDVHTHHVYWRLDFDILTAADNVVDEFNDPPIVAGSNWHTKQLEIRRLRDAGHKRHWRVRNRGTFRGYSIVPGGHDGNSDAYGVGDVWVLRYHGNEVDDGQGFTTNPALSRAGIDKFINGESVNGQDVVIWYAGHFQHDETHPDPAGHIVGPELIPFNF